MIAYKKESFRWRVAQFFEILWWKKYLRNKDKSEYLYGKKKYWEKIIQEIALQIGLSNQRHVLDVGCGPSGIYLVLNNLEIDALDPLINKYQESLFFFDRSDYQNVNFIHTSFEEFIITKKYDVVFCMNAINHVSNLQACFDKLVALTKIHGYLVITIDAHNFSFFKKLFRMMPVDILHPHQYDLSEYINMPVNRGCKMIFEKCLKKEFLFDHYLLVFQNKHE